MIFRRFLETLLVCAVLTSGCGRSESRTAAEAPSGKGAPGDCVKESLTVRKGVTYREICDQDDRPRVHLVAMDPRSVNIDPVIVKEGDARTVAIAEGAFFGINTNFFDERGKTLGLVASDGKTANPLHPVSWQAVLHVSPEGKASIVPQPEWAKRPKATGAAVQVGPRLTISGSRNRVARGEPTRRSGVCLNDEGLLFFVTAENVYLDVHDMVEIAAGELKCRDSLLFDGGPSAQMFLHTPKKRLWTGGDRVPAFLIAR